MAPRPDLRVYLFLRRIRWSAARSTRCARRWAHSLRAGARRCRRRRPGRIPAYPPRSAMQTRHSYDSASSATTMSADLNSATQNVRELGVRMKHSPTAADRGQGIVLIDDSWCAAPFEEIVKMMRDGGAREVIFRIASPPITHPDYYGIDTPTAKGFGGKHTLDEMRAIIGADSLAFCRWTASIAPWANRREPAHQSSRPLFHRRLPTQSPTSTTPRRNPGSCRCWRKRVERSQREALMAASAP